MTSRVDRSQLVLSEATMNQSRNMIYHLIRFMKKNNVADVKQRLREMGKNLARTFYKYWKPIDIVNLSNVKDVIATIYKKVLNSTVTIELDEMKQIIRIKDPKCALCKYHYEDVGNFAGCEILLGMVSEFILLINNDSQDQLKITLNPLEIPESLSYGDKACIQVLKYI